MRAGPLHPLVRQRHCSEQTFPRNAGVKFLAVRRDLFAVEHAVVTDDTCDPQAICRRPEAAELGSFHDQFIQKGKARLHLSVTIQEHGALAVAFEGTFVALK